MTPDSPTSLLLLSNSTNYSAKFLSHALEPIDGFLRGSDLVFVPFALADHQAYGDLVAGALSPLGVNVHVAPPDANGAALINEASAVFIGGGNTFRLLKTLQTLGVMRSVRERYAAGGLRYMGSSAGTNMACPTIRTTNDMPIVSPDGFEALGLIPFQINAHFQDDEAFEGHMGETRRTRLNEFLEENDVPVLALREGAWLAGDGKDKLTLGGENGAILFRRSQSGAVEEVDLAAGDDLSDLAGIDPLYDQPRQRTIV